MRYFFAATLVFCFSLSLAAGATAKDGANGETKNLLDGVARTVAYESVLCERDTAELEAAVKAAMKKTSNSEKDFLYAEMYYTGRVSHHMRDAFKKRGDAGVPDFCEEIKDTMPTVTQSLLNSLK